MKSIRKSLAFLVVFAMVLTCVAPVMAVTPTDVAGTDYDAAVGNLVALGIINGYEDGTFKPDNNITRAEFSKIACYLLGMQAAGSLGAATQFKDVPASHWASGYIALAAGKGIIKGYPGGLFKPEENVSYAEAITILVRAIGMGEFVEKQGGTWPSNYMAAGSMAGITSSVAGISSDGKAIRGIIAQLSWNALGAEKWGPKEYSTSGIVYGPQDKTLMEELYKNFVFKNTQNKYEIKWFEDVKVVGTYSKGDIDANQIKIDCSQNRELAQCLGSSSAETLVDVADGINTLTLYGLKVDLLFGKDNKVLNLRVATPAKDIVKGYLGEYKDGKLVVKANKDDDSDVGTKYSFANGYVVFINTLPVASAGISEFLTAALTTKTDSIEYALDKMGESNAVLTAVLDSGNIKALTITTCDVLKPSLYTHSSYLSTVKDGLVACKQFVVAEINKNNEVKNVGESRTKMFDLDDLTDTDDYIIIKNGKPAAKADIKAGDAVTYFEKAGFTFILVSDVKVTGKITKNTKDTLARDGDDRRKLTIDGKVYKMAADGCAAFTKNGDIEEDDVKDKIGTLSDFVEKEATLTLNTLGEVVFVNGKVTASSANLQVGVVVRALQISGDDYSLKILGQDGTSKSYTIVDGKAKVIIKDGDLDASATYDEVEVDKIYENAGGFPDTVKGQLVLFEVSADSKIKAENLYINGEASGVYNDHSVYMDDLYLDVAAVDGTKVDNENKELTADLASALGRTTGTDNVEFAAKSSTTYINIDTDNIEKIKGWDSLANNKENVWDNGDASATFLVSNEKQALKAIFVAVDPDGAGDPLYVGSDELYGVFVEAITDNNNDDWVTVLIDGASKEYKVAGSVYDELDEGDVVMFTLDGEGKFKADKSDVEAFDYATLKKLYDADNADAYKISDWDVGGKKITFKSNAEFGTYANIAADAYVYSVVGGKAKVASLSDIEKGKFVVVADKNDKGKYEVVVIFAE